MGRTRIASETSSLRYMRGEEEIDEERDRTIRGRGMDLTWLDLLSEKLLEHEEEKMRESARRKKKRL